MATRPTTAAVHLSRPPEPLTSTSLEAAMGPLLTLLGVKDPADVESVTITGRTVRLVLVPRSRGRRQHDSRLRVSYPVTWDLED